MPASQGPLAVQSFNKGTDSQQNVSNSSVRCGPSELSIGLSIPRVERAANHLPAPSASADHRKWIGIRDCELVDSPILSGEAAIPAVGQRRCVTGPAN